MRNLIKVKIWINFECISKELFDNRFKLYFILFGFKIVIDMMGRDRWVFLKMRFYFLLNRIFIEYFFCIGVVLG